MSSNYHKVCQSIFLLQDWEDFKSIVKERLNNIRVYDFSFERTQSVTEEPPFSLKLKVSSIGIEDYEISVHPGNFDMRFSPSSYVDWGQVNWNRVFQDNEIGKVAREACLSKKVPTYYCRVEDGYTNIVKEFQALGYDRLTRELKSFRKEALLRITNCVSEILRSPEFEERRKEFMKKDAIRVFRESIKLNEYLNDQDLMDSFLEAMHESTVERVLTL